MPRVPLSEIVVAYLDSVSPNRGGSRRAERGERPPGRERGQCRQHRGRGGRLPGDDRRGGRGAGRRITAASGASRPLLGRQRSPHRPALPSRARAARAGHRRSTPPTSLSISTPRSATTSCWPSGSASRWRDGSATIAASRSACGVTPRSGWPRANRCVLEVDHALGASASGTRLIPGGPEVVGRVGIITGGAGSMIAAARDAGLDTFITGEGASPHLFRRDGVGRQRAVRRALRH